jgi:ElaB/YqjD/DUF883 family membrane-anchored ribosome-binding protein
MGKRSDELRSEIDALRRQLDSKIDRLDERVRSDFRDSRETIDRDVRDRLHIQEYAEERPFLTLATAFGAGILLGTVTPAVPTPSMPGRRNGSRNDSQSGSSGGDAGIMAQLLGSATGALSGTLQDEVRDLFRQVTGSRDAQPERRSEFAESSEQRTGASSLRRYEGGAERDEERR